MSTLTGLRIGIVTPRLDLVGGTEIYLRRLMAVQRGLGAQVSTYTRQNAELGESLHPFRRPDAAAVVDTADRIVAACDVVEFHGCAPLPLLRALRGRRPVLLYAHTAELTCPAGGRMLRGSGAVCTRAPGLACLAVDVTQNCLCGPDGTRLPLAQRLKAPMRGSLTRAAMDLAWGVVFNSHALESLFLNTIGVAGRSYVLAPPLPDTLPFPAVRQGDRLLFAGRLQDFKGIHEAVRVCAALPQAELVVAGTGPAEKSARELAERLGVAGRLSFRGWQDGDAIASEMAQASCLLMPGRWFEAWGMTGPEAVAQGCAVVAWDVGGVREWCREPWGSLVPAGDEAGLVAATKARLESPPSEAERQNWRDAAQAQWGPQAFGLRYGAIAARAAEASRAARSIRVLHLQRKPMPGFHSIENLFAAVRRALPGDFDVRVRRSPRDNGGMLKRLSNLRAAADASADVVHVVGDSHYLALATDPARTVLTVHDCIALQRSTGLRRAALKRLYFTDPIAAAAVTTAISPKTAAELHELAGIDPGRVRVVPCCVSEGFSVGEPAGPFSVLLVGTLSHKNLERVINALGGTAMPLNVVGALSEPQRALLTASGLEWTNSVGLDSAGMASAYRRAGVLVFASTYEGFGLPVLEAQASGLPVVTSRLAPMDWVAGDGAILVDPASEAQIRAAVLRVASDANLRRELREAGFRNVERFSAEAVAAQYAAIYRELAT